MSKEKCYKINFMKKNKHRILIADMDESIFDALKQSREGKNYHFEWAKNGNECLEKIKLFKPELIIIDFFLPCVHAIEILKIVKEAPQLKKMGVIISSAHSMIQNYHAAVKMGANFYLEKPFSTSYLIALIKKYFNFQLFPEPFVEHKKAIKDSTKTYLPEAKNHSSYLKFWGTRGSNPVAGVDYVHFGGNTCCLEIRHQDDLVIIDAGTGIRVLGSVLNETSNKPYSILFSHTHWDHLMGFPFFKPIYHPNSEINLFAPIGFDKTAKELFSDVLTHAYFPVSLEDIRSKILFSDLRDSQKLTFGQIEIYTHYAFHPGSTLCFRIHMAGKKIGYVTDNEFLMGFYGHPKHALRRTQDLQSYQSQIAFFKGCDLMIHEAQYLPNEYKSKEGWGHSSVSNASVFIKLAGIHDWIITHHDPKHTDIDLLKKIQLHHDIMKDLNHPCHIRLAYDGMFVPIL